MRLKPIKKKIVGGNISRNSRNRKVPTRRASPAGGGGGSAGTSNSEDLRSSKTDAFRIGLLLVTARPVLRSLSQLHLHGSLANGSLQHCVVAIDFVGVGERDFIQRFVSCRRCVRRDRVEARRWLGTLLPGRAIYTSSDHPPSEHVLRIDLTLKPLTNAGPHHQCALWRNVPLKPEVEVGQVKLTEAVGDNQIRSSVIRAAREPFSSRWQGVAGAHVGYRTTYPRPVEAGCRVGGRACRVAGGSH